MSIKEAAGDANGHNRNVRKYNSIGRKARRIESEDNKLIDSRNSKTRCMNSLLDDIDEKCSSFPVSVIKKGCDNGYRSPVCGKL